MLLFFLREICKSYYEETISFNGKAQDKNLGLLVRVRHSLFFIFFLKGSIHHAN